MVYLNRNKRGPQWPLYFLFHFCGFIAVSIFLIAFAQPGLNVGIGTQALDLDSVVNRFEAKGEPEKAILFLLDRLREKPNNPNLKRLLGKISREQIIRDIALNLEILESDSRNVEAYLSIASAYDALGDTYSAFDILLSGIKISPNATELWMMMVKLEYENDRLNEAITLLKEVIRIDNKHSDANNNLAHMLITNDLKKDDIQALDYAKKAILLEPINANFLDTLASVYFALGEQELAIITIEKAIELEPMRIFFREQLARFKRID